MTVVRGWSDDVISVRLSMEDGIEIQCWNEDVRITFDDGTELACEYEYGYWHTRLLKEGEKDWYICEDFDNAGDKSTDIFITEAKISHYALGKRGWMHVGEG